LGERFIGHETVGLGGYEGSVGSVWDGEAVDGCGWGRVVVVARRVRI